MNIWGFGKKKTPAPAAEQSAPPLATPEPVAVAKPDEQAEDKEEKAERATLLGRLFGGLAKSSAKLAGDVTSVFTKKTLDQETLDELEDVLIRADMGPAAARRITGLMKEGRFNKDIDEDEVREALADAVTKIMTPREQPLDLTDGPRPRVVLVVGVNGSGKTTTIGKLCYLLSKAGAKVVVGAADTFRAAAIEQLGVWAQRSGAGFVARNQGADAAGVAFDAVQKARQDGADVVLIDTAGRLQNRAELMGELDKILRAIRKVDEDAPHETLLVLDATVGQNALSQTEAFRTTANVTGLVMTKLDGTAKGGVLVAIAERHALPIHFIGVGESAEDLQPFSARTYARALAGLKD